MITLRKIGGLKMAKVQNLLRVGYWLVLVVVSAVAGMLVLSAFDTPLKIRLFSVQSGSMEPAIPLGSVVMVRSADEYRVGDVVTVRAERDPKETVTHRVVSVEREDPGTVRYELKGDANEEADPELVGEGRVIGRVVGSLPYLGYPIAFAKTQAGFVTLIVVPATIIVYSEVVNIKNEAVEMVSGRRMRAVKMSDVTPDEPSEKRERKVKVAKRKKSPPRAKTKTKKRQKKTTKKK